MPIMRTFLGDDLEVVRLRRSLDIHLLCQGALPRDPVSVSERARAHESFLRIFEALQLSKHVRAPILVAVHPHLLPRDHEAGDAHPLRDLVCHLISAAGAHAHEVV